MKRLVSVCLFTLCLSIPVFAGHVVPGGYKCECGGPIPECVCDEGELPPGPNAPQRQPAGLGSETLLVLALLLVMLRYKP